MENIKADLHAHGPIGFEPYWLRVQGYEGKNLLQLIVESCIKKDIRIAAITSEAFEIPRGSIHDRLGYLAKMIKALPENYEAEMLGKESIVVKKGSKEVILLSGQTPIIEENGKRYDHLIVGSNRVPNGMNFSDTLQCCLDNGLPNFLEHPAVEEHCGTGLSLAEKLIMQHGDKITGIEGHNSNLVWPGFLSFAPKIGQYNRRANKMAKQLSEKIGKPYIANSDAHRIEDIGTSYIEFEAGLIDRTNEEKLIQSITKAISSKKFSTKESYVPLTAWLKTSYLFINGLKDEKYKKG